MNEEGEAVSPASYRSVLGHFATGLTIITALDGDEPVGFTCQSFTALSLTPPMVLFAPAKTSTTWPRIEAAGACTINVLNEDQEALCGRFATSGAAKFDGVRYHLGRTGAPVLDGVLASIDCRLTSVIEAGDHLIAVASVEHLEHGHGRPLLYFKGSFEALAH